MTPSINWSHTTSVVLPLIVFAIIIRRSLRERKVKTNRMWLYPAILGVVALYTMAHEPMPGLGAIAGFVAAAVAGAGLGYLRARHQQFTLDPVTGEISSKATPIGTIRWGHERPAVAIPPLAVRRLGQPQATRGNRLSARSSGLFAQ